MYFSELSFDELYQINGGCALCVTGGALGGASTSVGTVLFIASVVSVTPAAPVLIGAAVIGAGIGAALSK